MRCSRRDFVKGAAAAAALTAAPRGMAAESTSEVFVGKGTAAEIIPKILGKLGGIGQFVKTGSRVLIKPNMSFANPPEWGTGTTPEAVYTLTKMCLDAGAKRVIVCDNTLRDPELCKEKTGIDAVVKSLKGAVLYIPKQDGMFVTKTDERATTLRSVDIVKELDLVDCFFSLPCAKSHSAAAVSMNLKGLMGLVKKRSSYHGEMDLHTAIAEQLYYMRPTVSIVDATRALLDNGPAGPGKVVELNTFVGGLDPVAVDSHTVTLASWYGKSFEGKQVKHLKIAGELGLGNVESDKIKVTAV